MNWFGGMLEIWFLGDTNATTYYDVSLTKAQEILDAIPKGSVYRAIYRPYAIDMAQS